MNNFHNKLNYKVLFPGFFFCLFLFTLLSGCGGSRSGGNSGSNDVTLQFWGFPIDYPTDKIIIQLVNDTNLLAEYTYNCDPSQIFQQNITVPSNAVYIDVFLFCTSYISTDPVYCVSFRAGKQTYSNCYWLDYNLYVNNNGIIRFGVSESLAKNIISDLTDNLDFDEAPYFLYKLDGAQNITAALAASSGTIKEEDSQYLKTYDLSTISQFIANKSGTANWSKFIINSSGTYYILVEPGDYLTTTKATFKVKGIKGVSVTDTITKMVSGNTPNMIYAIGNKQYIYYINPVSQSANSYSISILPRALAYSSADNLLYILGADSIIIWDPIQNKSIATFSTTSYYNNRDIKVDSIYNRIYVLTFGTYNQLLIIDKSNGNIYSAPNINGYKIFLDSNQNLYTDYGGRYSVASDILSQTEPISDYSSSASIFGLSPDGSKVIVGDSIHHKVSCLKSNDFTQCIGTYDLQSYENPSVITFSSDGTMIYEINSDTSSEYNINVLNSSCSLIQTLPLMNVSGSPVLLSNSDGSLVSCCYTYDSSSNLISNFYLYGSNVFSLALKLGGNTSISKKQLLTGLPPKNSLQYNKYIKH